MKKVRNVNSNQITLGLPFFIIFGIIVIFYGGYLFGQRLFEMSH